MLEDGTIFDLPEPQVIDYDTATGQEVDFTLTAKAADQVTEADIAAAQATAAAAGADTTKVTNNASKANEKAASAQGGQVKQGTANAATKSNASKTGTTIPSQSGNNSNNQGNNGNQGGGEQAHQHSWTPVTQTVHHEAQYKTVHHDAQYKTVHHDAVTKKVLICKDCGAEITDRSHSIEEVRKGNSGSSYTTTKTVQAAYDEKVLVKAAYDETVTTGYRCSCGATKPAN